MASYALNDRQGSAQLLSNGAGAVLGREAWTPYGLPLELSDGPGQPGYTGHVWDGGMGLSYMQARYYDPLTARFNRPDPIGYRDGLNVYAYVGGDPANKIDPTGTDAIANRVAVAIMPVRSDVPAVTIPNRTTARGHPMASGISSDDGNHHVYRFETPTQGPGWSQQDGGARIAADPTPLPRTRFNGPATPEGTLNDAGPLGPQQMNFVYSFVVESPDPSRFTDITVNYTVRDGHIADEGFVMRYGAVEHGEVVSIVTYGEGNSFLQGARYSEYFATKMAEDAWNEVNRRINERHDREQK